MADWRFFRRGVRRPDKKHKEEAVVSVPEISEDQPRNPFSELQLLSSHTDIVHLLAAIDDRRFASASHDNTAIVWDAKTCKRLSILRGHTRPITCMLVLQQQQEYQNDDFAPLLLLTGSSDKAVWDLTDGQCLHIITEHNSSVKCLMNMKDLNVFFSGGQDLCMWDEQGKLIDKVERKSEPSDIHTLLPIKNQRIVAASDKQSLVIYSVTKGSNSSSAWKIQMCKKLSPHRESIRCLVNVADSMFASASLDGAIILWSSHSLSLTRQFNSIGDYEGDNHTYPCSVQHIFTVDQRHIFASIGRGFLLYDATTGRCLARKENAHYGKVLHSLLVIDGVYLATCSEDGSIRLWGSPNPVFDNGNQGTSAVTSPIERFLGKRISDTEASGKPVEPALLGECLAHSGTVHMSVNCAAEGFASCGSDGLVVMWKDGILQTERRNEMVRNILLYDSV